MQRGDVRPRHRTGHRHTHGSRPCTRASALIGILSASKRRHCQNTRRGATHTRVGPRARAHATARRTTQHIRLTRRGATHQHTAQQPESWRSQSGAARRILEAGWRTDRRRRIEARGADRAAHDCASPPSPTAPTVPSSALGSERPLSRRCHRGVSSQNRPL